MNMDAYWSGFLTAVAIVCLAVSVIVLDGVGWRVTVGMTAGCAGLFAALLSHDARTP